MDSITQNKGFIITTLVTIILLVGGVFFFSRNSGPSEPKKVSTEILAPADAVKTATGSAEITLVEFGDYQCPACGVYHPFVKRLITEEPKVNFIFRHFPLTQHPNAPMASNAVIASGLQGKYWQMHDMMFEKQTDWSDLADPKAKFTEYAKELLLDTDKFMADMLSKDTENKVKKDYADGLLVGINATPTYFVNGVKIELPSTYEAFKNLVLTSK